MLIKIVYCGSLYPPHILSESSSVLDDNSAHKNSGIFSEQSQKGTSNLQESNGINKEHQSKQVSGHDTGTYNHENAQKNNQENTGQREEEKYHQQNFDTMNKNGRKGGHKKGHHKSGFHNTYHKDESENNSSFYDDSDDQGGHFEYNSQNGVGGQTGGDRFKESYDNGRYDSKYDGKKVNHDVNGHYGNERGDKAAYDQKNYYNDRRDQRNSNVGNARGETGRNQEEGRFYRYPSYRDQPYREPDYRRYEPKKTITIYEDPRMYQRGYTDYQRPYERRYDSDNVHLDFRRSGPYRGNSYPYRRPFYGYYHYK